MYNYTIKGIHMNYRIQDIALAPWGHREIAIAQHEMPGLMAIQAKFRDQQPLKGRRIMGYLHMKKQKSEAKRS